MFLQIGGLCSGIVFKNNKLKIKFVNKLIFNANNLNIDVSLLLADKQSEPIPQIGPTLLGGKLARLNKVNFVGQMIFNRLCRQIDLIAVDGPLKFTVENEFIFTAQVVGQVDD